jgi:hypothetical protein
LTEVTVVVRAGLPGDDPKEPSDEKRYLSGTSDFVKLLRERGYSVSYEHDKADRELVMYQSADLWLPVFDFTMNVAANIPASIIATMIMDYFGGVQSRVTAAKLKVKYYTRDSTGAVRKFKASGSGDHVIRVMETFEREIHE